MSKSLKNFITIKEFLSLQSGYSTNPNTDFRIMCLQQHYSMPMYFSKERVHEATIFREKMVAFYSVYNSAIALTKGSVSSGSSSGSSSVGRSENHDNSNSTASHSSMHTIIASSSPCRPTIGSMKLQSSLRRGRVDVETHLRNDFDTPSVLKLLVNVVAEGSIYCTQFILQQQQYQQIQRSIRNGENLTVDQQDFIRFMLPFDPLISLEVFLENTLTLFGLDIHDFNPNGNSISFMNANDGNGDIRTNSSNAIRQDTINGNTAVSILCEYRKKVRKATLHAMKNTSKISKMQKKMNGNVLSTDQVSDNIEIEKQLGEISDDLKSIMTACDWVRNDASAHIGIKIDDIGEDCSWRPITK